MVTKQSRIDREALCARNVVVGSAYRIDIRFTNGLCQHPGVYGADAASAEYQYSWWWLRHV